MNFIHAVKVLMGQENRSTLRNSEVSAFKEFIS